MKPLEVNELTSITYLKSEQVSKVLADGFALIYDRKPEYPVTFLANYLLNCSKKKKEQDALQQVINQKRSIIEDFKRKKEEREAGTLKKAEGEKIAKDKQSIFDKKIKDHECHLYVLNEICDELERRFKLAGVYIGQVKHPKRIMKEEEESETAHLELEQPKRIQYIAYSKSQEGIMKDRHLPLDSVTGGLFQDKPPEEAEPQDEQKKEKAPNYVYIPEVVKNPRMVYFRLPKLGSYIAIPLICKTYLTEKLFEAGLEEVQKYNKLVEEAEKEKQKRDNEFREQYEEKQRSGADERELQEMELKYEQEKATIQGPPAPVLPSVDRQMVVCCDTMGLQRQIPLQVQKALANYVQFVKSSWQERQRSYLMSDIDSYIKYLQSLELPVADLLTKMAQEEQKQLTPDLEEIAKYKANEKLYNFQLDSLRLDKIKDQFQDERYVQHFNNLKSSNVLLYPGVMQAALYFLGYSKADINLPSSNVLNWRQVRNILVKDKFIERLVEYSHRGSKDKEIVSYAKWNKLLLQLEKYDLNAVLGYNLFYGKLLKYLLMTGKLRKIDCQLRAEKIEQARKAREERIAENQKIEAQKERIREEQKTLSQEKEDHVFDEEAWEQQYNEEHPLQEVGDEIPSDIDRDFQEEAPPAAA